MNNCPQCQSDRTQKITAIYEQETGDSQFSGHSMKGGSFSGSGSHRSKLGQRFSPPQKVYAWWVYGLIAIGSQLIPLIGFFISCYYLFRLLQSLLGIRTQTQYERRLQYWHKAWYCHQCGSVFEPNEMFLKQQLIF